jgi:glycosyltransferase involved in cell wall biosynthesis
MSVTVIIPTTGAPELSKAIESVLLNHDTICYVVCDGEENAGKVKVITSEFAGNKNLKVSVLPINVGANGFYGHRVYASFTHLVNTEYVLYLDQDNWFHPDHVQSCVDTIEEGKLDWCYSLRKIRSKDGTFICNDDCESLGKWQSYHGINHVDTNSYCLKTSVAIQLASAWHGGWGQDRVFLATVSKYFPNYDCTKKYSVNYRVDGNAGSVTGDFFLNGNEVMKQKYNGVFPWNTI